MFVKLFTQILDSSIADNRRLRHFFTDLLLCADCKGYVMMTTSAIARRTGAELEEVEWGLSELSKPDPHSKTPDFDGRRIEVVDDQGYGWRILNYETYRSMRDADQLRDAAKERAQRYRDKKKAEKAAAKDGNATTKRHARVTPVTPSNAITEGEAESDSDVEAVQNNYSTSDSVPSASREDLSWMEDLWKATPQRGRTRSSKHEMREMWKKIPKRERPEPAEVIAAMRKWADSDEWSRENDQYIPGLDKWIKKRKWESIPERTYRPGETGPMPLD